MTRILALAILLAVAGPTIADDFRGHSWGNSQKSVKSVEKSELFGSKEDSLYYNGSLAEIKVVISYSCLNDRLVQGAYLNDEFHINKNDFISDYEKFRELLTKKYGDRKEDQVFWRNDLYKNDPLYWGVAVSIGHLVYRALWETERTSIISALHGDNFNVSHGVVYDEKATEATRGEKKEKEALDQL